MTYDIIIQEDEDFKLLKISPTPVINIPEHVIVDVKPEFGDILKDVYETFDDEPIKSVTGMSNGGGHGWFAGTSWGPK